MMNDAYSKMFSLSTVSPAQLFVLILLRKDVRRKKNQTQTKKLFKKTVTISWPGKIFSLPNWSLRMLKLLSLARLSCPSRIPLEVFRTDS